MGEVVASWLLYLQSSRVVNITKRQSKTALVSFSGEPRRLADQMARTRMRPCLLSPDTRVPSPALALPIVALDVALIPQLGCVDATPHRHKVAWTEFNWRVRVLVHIFLRPQSVPALPA